MTMKTLNASTSESFIRTESIFCLFFSPMTSQYGVLIHLIGFRAGSSRVSIDFHCDDRIESDFIGFGGRFGGLSLIDDVTESFCLLAATVDVIFAPGMGGDGVHLGLLSADRPFIAPVRNTATRTRTGQQKDLVRTKINKIKSNKREKKGPPSGPLRVGTLWTPTSCHIEIKTAALFDVPHFRDTRTDRH